MNDNDAINEIIFHMKKNGGIVYETPYFLNLFAIRDSDNPNTFNDKLFVFWYDESGKVNVFSPQKGFTTDPGFKSLTSPVSSNGCAILREGWYQKLWTIGKHNGKYTALVQGGGPCAVYRDRNRNKLLEMDDRSVDTGWFGINMHRANEIGTATKVENWSAGCQVWANSGEFRQFMNLVNKANNCGQSVFSYFLTNKKMMAGIDINYVKIDASGDMGAVGNGFYGKELVINYGGSTTHEANKVINLSKARNRQKGSDPNLNENRKKDFDALANRLIEETPSLGRTITKSQEMYDASILKGDQVSKQRIK